MLCEELKRCYHFSFFSSPCPRGVPSILFHFRPSPPLPPRVPPLSPSSPPLFLWGRPDGKRSKVKVLLFSLSLFSFFYILPSLSENRKSPNIFYGMENDRKILMCHWRIPSLWPVRSSIHLFSTFFFREGGKKVLAFLLPSYSPLLFNVVRPPLPSLLSLYP